MSFHDVDRSVNSELDASTRVLARVGLASGLCKAYHAASGDLEHLLEGMEDSTMPLTKQASKRKRRKEVVPALGVVGMSLSLAGGASAAGTAGPVADLPTKDTAPGPEIHAQRRGDLRRQPGDILCLRQGKRRNPEARSSNLPAHAAAAEVAAAVAEAAEAAAEVAEAAAGAEAAEAAAAACPGEFAASARLGRVSDCVGRRKAS